VAMQIFLDANPQYWRFVPMSIEESQRPEQQSIQPPHLPDQLDWNLRSKEDCFIYLEAVPKPPTGYTFSNRQLLLQTQYLYDVSDRYMETEHALQKIGFVQNLYPGEKPLRFRTNLPNLKCVQFTR